MEKPTESQKGKKPLYIDIYDQLFAQIKRGVYLPGGKLPAENELAGLFGVSRMTLRQALSLLQDDGLIKSVHGKGSFVTELEQKSRAGGLEKLGNPMHASHALELDEVLLDFRLDVESDYTRQVLKQKAAAVAAFERWYKHQGEVVGYAFTFMAIETVSDMNLDLQDKDQLLAFLERDVYERANGAEIEIKRSASVSSPEQTYSIAGSEESDLLLESVYMQAENPIVYNKYYIPREYSVLRIHAGK